MKRILIIAMAVLCSLFLFGCAPAQTAQVAATTLPVYEMTAHLCAGTDISVARLITENVSCLHDYSLQVDQMRTMEQAQLVVISGAGLEDFLELSGVKAVIDASQGIHTAAADHDHHNHHDHDGAHAHEEDPHIWLSIENARAMAQNICQGLILAYPEHESRFRTNLVSLDEDFTALEHYAGDALSSLSCRDIITFHDGFSYMAESFDLTILKAVEEESGSEASARELKELIGLVQENRLPVIFTEKNGSTSAAAVISAETGAKIYTLDMAMSGDSYFEAMYHNIDTLKEALG